MKQSEQQAVTKLFDKDSTIRESQVNTCMLHQMCEPGDIYCIIKSQLLNFMHTISDKS